MMLNLPLTTMGSGVYAQPVAHLRATGFDVPQQERPGAQLKRLSFVPRFYDGCCEGSSERRSLLRGMSTFLPSNAVAINGTRPVTTSLVIADVFGKRHDNVLRDIETLECSDTFRLLNFEERNRELVTGKNTVQEYRYFDITKDGFVFLVMGYRGPKAAQFKEAYISRFNELEDGLRSPTIPALPALITVAQQGELATLIAERFPNGKNRPYAWSRFNNHFRLSRYRDLPASRFEEACAYIPAIPMPGGSETPALPAPVIDPALTPISDRLAHGRFLATFDNNRLHLREIEHDAYIMADHRWPNVIRHEPVTPEVLLDLLDAVAAKLNRRPS